MKVPFHARARGFTLVELLVVIAILIVLASLIFIGSSKALESARIVGNVNNLRNIGPSLTSYAQNNGGYPPCWSFSRGESWAAKVVVENTGTKQQDPSLLSPLVARDIPRDRPGYIITNYSASAIVFPQEALEPGTEEEVRPYPLTPMMMRRPSEQILLGDGLPSSDDAPYGFTMTVWWDLRGAKVGTRSAGSSVPVSDEDKAEDPVTLPANILELTNCGKRGLPAFRNRGKCHFLFADGHVEGLVPEDLKQKHFAVSY